jgi:hypothetical protein
MGEVASQDLGAQGSQGRITVARTSPDDVEQRQIIVKLDGKRIGELMYGQEMTIPVGAGSHRLTVDNTWNWKTLNVNVAEGEHLRFQTRSRAGRWTWFLGSVFGAGPIHVSIDRQA